MRLARAAICLSSFKMLAAGSDALEQAAALLGLPPDLLLAGAASFGLVIAIALLVSVKLVVSYVLRSCRGSKAYYQASQQSIDDIEEGVSPISSPNLGPAARESHGSLPPSPRYSCDDEDYTAFSKQPRGSSGRSTGTESSQDQRAGSAGASTGRRHKTHCFLILGNDYYQKQVKLSPKAIATVGQLHAALEELFSEEFFAFELIARRGASRDDARVRVADMELQYLDDSSGAPSLVSHSVAISQVLASSALLLSDRPVSELVAAGCAASSESFQARSRCSNGGGSGAGGGAGGSSVRRGKKQLGSASARLLLSYLPEPAQSTLPLTGQGASLASVAYDHSTSAKRPAVSSRRRAGSGRRMLTMVDPALPRDADEVDDDSCVAQHGGAAQRGAVVAVPAAFFSVVGRQVSDPFLQPA